MCPDFYFAQASNEILFARFTSIFHGYRCVVIYYCLQTLIHILTSGAHIVKLRENTWRIYKVRGILGLCCCAVPSYSTYRIWWSKQLSFVRRHVIWQLHHPRHAVGSPLSPKKGPSIPFAELKICEQMSPEESAIRPCASWEMAQFYIYCLVCSLREGSNE